jgi:hypothetical protein
MADLSIGGSIFEVLDRFAAGIETIELVLLPASVIPR